MSPSSIETNGYHLIVCLILFKFGINDKFFSFLFFIFVIGFFKKSSFNFLSISIILKILLLCTKGEKFFNEKFATQISFIFIYTIFPDKLRGRK